MSFLDLAAQLRRITPDTPAEKADERVHAIGVRAALQFLKERDNGTRGIFQDSEWWLLTAADLKTNAKVITPTWRRTPHLMSATLHGYWLHSIVRGLARLYPERLGNPYAVGGAKIRVEPALGTDVPPPLNLTYDPASWQYRAEDYITACEILDSLAKLGRLTREAECLAERTRSRFNQLSSESARSELAAAARESQEARQRLVNELESSGLGSDPAFAPEIEAFQNALAKVDVPAITDDLGQAIERVVRDSFVIPCGTPITDALQRLWAVAEKCAPRVTGDGSDDDETAWREFQAEQQKCNKAMATLLNSAREKKAVSLGDVRELKAKYEEFRRSLENTVQDATNSPLAAYTELRHQWADVMELAGEIENWVMPKPHKQRSQRKRKLKRTRKKRTEMTKKQEFVYELRKLNYSFTEIGKRLAGAFPSSKKGPSSKQAAKRLYDRAIEVKRNHGASVSNRRPLPSQT